MADAFSASSSIVGKQRSSTGHVLLPASESRHNSVIVHLVPTRTLVRWTFGRGTVIWRIWPAVLLHTLFAAAVVSLSLRTKVHLGIPNVMLTLLGVVIGFVISYRAISGYDRYWQGRSALKPPSDAEKNGEKVKVEVSVVERVMAEKNMALDLVEGYAIALKHHLRSERGIYYEDLYPLVRPLHEHAHHAHHDHDHERGRQPKASPDKSAPTVVESPSILQVELPSSSANGTATLDARPSAATHTQDAFRNPVIPPLNAYGAVLTPVPPPHPRVDSEDSISSERRPLLPGSVPPRPRRSPFNSVFADLVPFSNVWRVLGWMLGWRQRSSDVEGQEREQNGDDVVDVTQPGARPNPYSRMRLNTETSRRLGLSHVKHRPRLAGGGENLPLEIVRCLSIWLSVLDTRGCVPGSALGPMIGCMTNFEDHLSTLERILTTPLPFVYSVHIRHTVWIYLFFLPFQLVDLFGWYAIPGVGIAAFIYLGLVASGEELEQPFGYDENDLDLDFFCREVVHADIERLKRMPCPNVYLDMHHTGDRIELENPSDMENMPIDRVFGGRH
ncbi:hypothetical protein A0H81_14067 [Grifola frondosa]|uniref:Uncharacterized protein n=1 Tax=Grifola frondosa TaxID=5627 RepID=A0A1C7LMH0_GRIFR|nr:hypothetical protein A0H81_14067 [Grifola frondosa]